jgi:hypothetical protein
MRTTSGGRAGGLAGRRVGEDDRPDERDREPVDAVLLFERGFGLLADRAGEDVRVAMAGEPTARCHASPICHTPHTRLRSR